MSSAKQGTTDEWEDSLGRVFRPGDLVAVATISDKSPQMVIAQVERINTTNAKGVPHTKRVRTGRKVEQEYQTMAWAGPEDTPIHDRYKSRDLWERQTEKRVVDEWEEVPDVTVTARPLLDGRSFYRSADRKAVTYTFIGNIVKLPADALEKVASNE